MSEQAAPGTAIRITIGYSLWYHDPSLDQHFRPRAARVIGAGGLPHFVNVAVDMDPVLDVARGKPPIIQRRNVRVFSAYPKNWPSEEFCVVPGLGLEQLESNPKASPHGGIRPHPYAGFVSPVDAFASGPVPPPAPAVSVSPSPKDPDVLGYTGPARLNGPDGRPLPIPAPAQDHPVRDDAHKALHGTLRRLLALPSWNRTFDGIPHRIVNRETAFEVVAEKTSQTVARFSFDEEGYSMAIGDGTRMVETENGLRELPDINRAIKIVAKAVADSMPAKVAPVPTSPQKRKPGRPKGSGKKKSKWVAV